MKYGRFEEVPVWQAGAEMAVRIFEMTEEATFRFKGDIANQIQRAALSVTNNIAEGFERGTTQELLTFLYYAKGSAGEVRSILCVMERMRAFGHLKSEISDLKSKSESVSRQLGAWAASLQNTDIPGHRYLTEKSRRTYEQKKSSDEFMEKIRRINEEQARKRAEQRRPQAERGEDISDLRSER